jgi:hypothetical protein
MSSHTVIEVMPAAEQHLANVKVVVDDTTAFRCASVILHRRSAMFREMLGADVVREDGMSRLAIPSNGFGIDTIRDALVALHSGTYPESLERRMALLGPLDWWAAEVPADEARKIVDGLDIAVDAHMQLIKGMPSATRRHLDFLRLCRPPDTPPGTALKGAVLVEWVDRMATLWLVANDAADPKLGAAMVKACAVKLKMVHVRQYLDPTVVAKPADAALNFLGRVCVEHTLAAVDRKRKRDVARGPPVHLNPLFDE